MCLIQLGSPALHIAMVPRTSRTPGQTATGGKGFSLGVTWPPLGSIMYCTSPQGHAPPNCQDRQQLMKELDSPGLP